MKKNKFHFKLPDNISPDMRPFIPENVGALLNPAGKRSKGKFLGLEIGEETLKILAFQDDRPIAAVSENIREMSDLEISQKITAFLQAKAFQPKKVFLSHPTHNLTTRVLALPSVDPKEIGDIVDLQAVKQTPHSREEITSGFQIVDSDPSGYSRVLVAITHRDIPSRYFKIAELAGLHPDEMTLSIQGTQSWYGLHADDTPASKNEAVLLLDVDTSTTDFLILSNDRIIFSRSLGVGARQLSEQGTVKEEEFVREIQRTLESSGAELKGETVSQVILTGVNAPLKDFSAFVVRELNMPCRVVPVFSEARKSAGQSGTENNADVSFAALLGMAFHPEKMSINLTPPDVKARRSLEVRARELATLGTLFLALVMTFSLVAVEKIVRKNAYLSDLQKEYSRLESEAGGVERLVAKMRLAGEEIRAGGGALDVIGDVTEVIPDDISMTSIEYNAKERTVLLRGVSDQMSAVFQFLTTLEGTPNLESVKTRNVSKRKVEEKELAEFEIAAYIRGPKPGVS